MAIRKPSVSVDEARRLATASPGLAKSTSTPKLVPPGGNGDRSIADPKADIAKAPLHAKAKLIPTNAGSSQSVSTQTSVSSGEKFPAINMMDAEYEPRVQVFLSARFPASGVSAGFDFLCKQYQPTKALQMILRRALDNYENMLSDGSFRKASDVYLLEEDTSKTGLIQTSRIMPTHLVEIARAYFDPLGFESTRAFGQKLAGAALATFFELEKKRRR